MDNKRIQFVKRPVASGTFRNSLNNKTVGTKGNFKPKGRSPQADRYRKSSFLSEVGNIIMGGKDHNLMNESDMKNQKRLS